MSLVEQGDFGIEVKHPDVLDRVYFVVDGDGEPLDSAQEVVEQLEEKRHQLRSEVLESFPAEQLSDAISPDEIRAQIEEEGFVTSPVVVIPDNEKAQNHIIGLFEKHTAIGGAEQASELRDLIRDNYNSLTAYSTDIDAVLYQNPYNRINSQPKDDRALDEEFSRIILAHELGHSVLRQPEVVEVVVDKSGNIQNPRFLHSGFGKYVIPYEIEGAGFWNGDVWGEGSATLVATAAYRGDFDDSNNTVPGLGKFKIPGYLWSEATDGTGVADNHALAAAVIDDYDTMYPGLLDEMFAFLKGDISREGFEAFVDDKQPGLFDKLMDATHEGHFISLAQEHGRVVESYL